MLGLIVALIGCNSRGENNSDRIIVGQWQNINHSDAGIEFGENGQYYVLNHNERIVIENPTILKYTFNADMMDPYNFTLTETTTGFKYDGKLTFLDKDNIQLSLYVNDTPNHDSFLSRVTD